MDKKLQLQLTNENQTNILTSFYCELLEQGFSFKVYDGELFHDACSLDDILDLYHDLNVTHIYVTRGSYRARASFILGNNEDGVYCMYDYSCSLKSFISRTLAFIERLAKERCERLGLDY